MTKTDQAAVNFPWAESPQIDRPAANGVAEVLTEELCFLSACELVRRYRAGSLSPVEATQAVLDRIADVNPDVNALYHVDAERALDAARAAEGRWHRGAPMGVLDGVPVTLKDSVRVAGMPTPNGTRALADRPYEPEDSPVTARLREHGATIIGKTTMPDLGMIPSGISSLHGVTRNPWNLERSSGGSSAGAGAAVASGMGPIAIGSDIGGSVRIPAAFCGIVGLKPSYGRVPIADPWPALVAGPMARSVTDVALVLGVISRPDSRDYTSLPWDDRNYLDRIDAGVRGLSIGLLTDMGFGLPVHPEIRSLIEAAAGIFASLGAIVTPMPPIFDADPEPDFDHMVQAYGWAEFSTLGAERQALVLPEIAEWCRGGERVSAADMIRAGAGIRATRRRVIAGCAPFDYVISPTMATEAFAAEAPWTPGGTVHNPFCFPFNLSEQPSISLCCGFTGGGLPVGLQIVGRRFDDAGVLRVARAYERSRSPLPGRPPRTARSGPFAGAGS
jgi:Asp-tRNA(Asn)/Glu-tRNA(Gln) amidotransferase A subunit family amidase